MILYRITYWYRPAFPHEEYECKIYYRFNYFCPKSWSACTPTARRVCICCSYTRRSNGASDAPMLHAPDYRIQNLPYGIHCNRIRVCHLLLSVHSCAALHGPHIRARPPGVFLLGHLCKLKKS